MRLFTTTCDELRLDRTIHEPMLTEQELNKIFSWLPYRDAWIIDKRGKAVYQSGKEVYQALIDDFINNQHFETLYSQDGGMSNYLEFFCYPINHKAGRINAVIVCISVCAPIAAYGQTNIYWDSHSIGYQFLEAENVGVVVDKELLTIEDEIRALLNKHKLLLIDRVFANKELPSEVVRNMENFNEGTKYLHGLFQWID